MPNQNQNPYLKKITGMSMLKFNVDCFVLGLVIGQFINKNCGNFYICFEFFFLFFFL